METKAQLEQMALALAQEIQVEQVLREQTEQMALQETKARLVQMALVLD
jgi:hypothetical protein